MLAERTGAPPSRGRAPAPRPATLAWRSLAALPGAFHPRPLPRGPSAGAACRRAPPPSMPRHRGGEEA
eukprot:11156274-Lingulodinium_polyedra.AAC.1